MKQFLVNSLALTRRSAVLAGCGTTKVVDTWQSDTIAAGSYRRSWRSWWPGRTRCERLVIERDAVAQLRDKGVNAVESSELPGMRGKLTRESVEVALRNANVDAVIIVYVIGGGQGPQYERADYWVQNVGTGVGWLVQPLFLRCVHGS